MRRRPARTGIRPAAVPAHRSDIRESRRAAPSRSGARARSTSTVLLCGLRSRSTAPLFIARTALSTSAWPGMMMTGVRIPRLASSSCNSRPLVPGIVMSNTIRHSRPGPNHTREKRPRVRERLDRQAGRVHEPACHLAQVRVIIDQEDGWLEVHSVRLPWRVAAGAQPVCRPPSARWPLAGARAPRRRRCVIIGPPWKRFVGALYSGLKQRKQRRNRPLPEPHAGGTRDCSQSKLRATSGSHSGPR